MTLAGERRRGLLGYALILLLGYLLSTTDLQALFLRVRGGDTLLLGAAMLVYATILALSIWRWQVLPRASSSSFQRQVATASITA